MRKLIAGILAGYAGALGATTYYWVANDVGSQMWADATNLENWSMAWVDGAPDALQHPAALPTSSDELWLCRDMMLDLNGQTWTMKPHQMGYKYKLGGTGEYWGDTTHVFALRNGKLELTGAEFRMRSTAGYKIYKDGILSLPYYPKPGESMGTVVPIDVYEGGQLLMLGHVQLYHTTITVHGGGYLSVGRLYLLNSTTQANVIENYGTVEARDEWTFRQHYNYGQNSAAKLTLRQKAGVWKLFGNIDKEEAGTKKARHPYLFELSGGTLDCQGDVAFGDTECSMPAGADATVAIAAGKTVDFSTFSYAEDAKLTVSGVGTLKLNTNYPRDLTVASGTVDLGSGAPSFGALTLAETSELILKRGLAVDTLAVANGAKVRTSGFAAGDVLLTATESTGLTAFAKAVNALSEETGITVVVSGNQVVCGAMADERNTLTVASGEMTWSAYVAANGVPSTGIPLVKKGLGTLVADADLSAYSGGLVIAEGAWAIDSANQLCAAEGTVIVSNGASLVVNPQTENSLDFGSRTLHLRGEGVAGRGALCDTASNNQTGFAGLLSGTVILDGDTTVAATGSGRKDFATGLKLNMNGHTLTINRAHVEYKICFYATAPFENPGHIVMNSAGVLFDVNSRLEGFSSGTAENTLTLSESAVVEFYDAPCTYGNWTIVWPNGGYPKFKSGTSIYPGPMAFEKGTFYIQGNSGCGLTLPGKVSGSGTLYFNQHAFTLKMPNTENTFSGAITGMNGDTIQGVNFASVTLAGGTSTILPVAGWREGSQVFDPADESAVRAQFDAGPITLGGPTVNKLKYFTNQSAWKNYMLVSYEGYLNVPGTENVTWNIHLCMNHYARLWIDGVCAISQSWWTDNKNVDVTLTPGYHHIVLNAIATTAKGPSSANNAWQDASGKNCATKGFAIKYSPGVGASSDEYTVPAEDGQGGTFTLSPAVSVERLDVAAGAQLSLGAQPLVIGELTGCPTFVGGPASVTITGMWNLAAMDVGVKTMAVNGTLGFGPDAILSIANAHFHCREETPLAVAAGGLLHPLPKIVPARKIGRLGISSDGKSLVMWPIGFDIFFR